MAAVEGFVGHVARGEAWGAGRDVTAYLDVSATDVLEHFPLGIVLVDERGTLLRANREAASLLGDDELGSRFPPPQCCQLFRCSSPGSPLQRCLTELALEASRGLPEFRIDVGPNDDSAVWVTAARAPGGVVFSLRRGSRGDRRRRTEPHWSAGLGLRIQALGPTKISSRESSLDGEWLEHRTGQLLKFLIAERRRPMHAEEIAAALWPTAGPEALRNLRHCIHVLREKLEPQRAKHRASSFVLARNGGYALDTTRAWIDADEFEDQARAGLAALAHGDSRDALGHLSAALALYGGDFLADQPYADWAFAERDRLRDLAGETLRAISEIYLASGEIDLATEHLQRLASVDPFDVDVQRQLIGLHLSVGRRSQAVRRYNRVRQRMLKAFGEELNFDLSDLTRENARGS
jgi:DNA-binding SARP family transcriptional activator